MSMRPGEDASATNTPTWQFTTPPAVPLHYGAPPADADNRDMSAPQARQTRYAVKPGNASKARVDGSFQDRGFGHSYGLSGSCDAAIVAAMY